jgi:hypothetical protein
MDQDADDSVATQDGSGAGGYVCARAEQGVPHHPRQQRSGGGKEVEPHPAIVRGLQLFRSLASGGAAAQTLFSRPDIHVSYAWFKSGFPLPLHSHDKDCYYLLIAGPISVGTEIPGKGDGVFIPNGAPYTVMPGEEVSKSSQCERRLTTTLAIARKAMPIGIASPNLNWPARSVGQTKNSFMV